MYGEDEIVEAYNDSIRDGDEVYIWAGKIVGDKLVVTQCKDREGWDEYAYAFPLRLFTNSSKWEIISHGKEVE